MIIDRVYAELENMINAENTPSPKLKDSIISFMNAYEALSEMKFDISSQGALTEIQNDIKILFQDGDENPFATFITQTAQKIDVTLLDLKFALIRKKKMLRIMGDDPRLLTTEDPDTPTLVLSSKTEDALWNIPKNLNTLVLEYCKLSERALEAIGSLTELNTLEMLGCTFQTADLNHLLGCQNLKKLKFHPNFNLKLLKKFPHLESLHISGRVLSPEGMKQIAEVSQLQELILNGRLRHNLIDESIKPLTQLKNLETLIIHLPAALTDRCLETIGQMASLKTLRIPDGDNFTDKGVCHLLSCVKLEELELSFTQLTEKGLHALKYLPCLKTLTLEASRITFDGVKVLAEFPALESAKIGGEAFWSTETQKAVIAYGKEIGVEIQCS